MARRVLFLACLCVLLGAATSAFSATPKEAPWITREGAVAMLVESKPEWKGDLARVRANLAPMPIYTDTDQDEWYIPYLEVAFAKGLIEATDFHREFRPGELLKQGEAMALAVRYKANGDESKIPQEEPDHPLSIPLHVQKAYDMNLTFPDPFESWNVIRRSDWYTLARSAGVPSPESITLIIPPKTVTPAPSLPVAGPIDQGLLDQPIFPQNQPTYVQPTNTGFKPENSAPVQPIFSQPTFVPNPPGSQPVSSDDSFLNTSQPVVSQPVNSNPTNTTTQTAPTNQFTISIPALGINNMKVSHPSSVTTQQGLLAPLQVGLGHLFSYPGNGGTVLVYGHSSSYSWDVSEFTKIFRTINKLNPGDRISITYGGKTYNYEVTHKQTVDASDMSAYQGTGSEKLILYTCWPPDDVKQRYLVHAKPV